MPRRVKPLQPCTQDRNGAAIDIQRALMRRPINAQCQTTGDDEATPRQTAGETQRIVQPRPRSAAAAHHGQLRAFKQAGVTLDEQQWRSIRQFGQQRRVGGVVPHQQMVVGLLQPGQSGGSTFADRCAAAGFGTAGRQAQRTPGAGRCAERG